MEQLDLPFLIIPDQTPDSALMARLDTMSARLDTLSARMDSLQVAVASSRPSPLESVRAYANTGLGLAAVVLLVVLLLRKR